jgi:hypothetical protein
MQTGPFRGGCGVGEAGILPPPMRRLVLLGAALFTAFVVIADATASDPNRETIRLNASDQAAARAVVLKKADLRARGFWTGGNTKPDLTPNPTCPDYHPDLSQFVVTGAAASDWKTGIIEIQTQSEVLQTARMVRKEWQLQIQAPGAIACLRSITNKEFASGARLVSFTRIPFPHIATYTAAFRIVVASSNVRAVIHVAVFGRSRTEVSLTMGGLYSARASIASETKRLARVLASRINA